MTAQEWDDEDRDDLLTLVATGPLFGDDAENRFLTACYADARAHGHVSVNRVRAALTVKGELSIEPRRFSALWGIHTGKGRAMRTTDRVEVCKGSTNRNDGRLFRLRVWQGEAP